MADNNKKKSFKKKLSKNIGIVIMIALIHIWILPSIRLETHEWNAMM